MSSLVLADVDWAAVVANVLWTIVWFILGLLYLLFTPVGWLVLGGWATKQLFKVLPNKGDFIVGLVFWVVLLLIVGSEFTMYRSGESFWDFTFTHLFYNPIPIQAVQGIAPLAVLQHIAAQWGSSSMTVPGGTSPTPGSTPTPDSVPTN